MEEPKLRPIRKSSLAVLADAISIVQKVRVAAQVRLSHLKRYGKTCPDTEELLKRASPLEEWLVETMAGHLDAHPAYWWFSHVKGIGGENIAKVVGRLEAFGRYYDEGDLMIPPEVSRELEEYITLDGDGNEVLRMGIWVEGIERLVTPSKQRVLAGLAPGIDRKRGERHSYDAELKMLFWRVGSSILRAGLRQKCDSCGNLFGTKHKKCPECNSESFHQVAVSEFAKFYLNYKNYLVRRETGNGTMIIPTPKARYCPECNKEVVKKAAKFCPDCGGPLSQKKEPPGVLYAGHLHMMAQRRMQQLFSDLLNVAWRDALGLPTRIPYPIEFLGHSTVIRPKDMMDKRCSLKGCPLCKHIEKATLLEKTNNVERARPGEKTSDNERATGSEKTGR